jgi:TonB family protein
MNTVFEHWRISAVGTCAGIAFVGILFVWFQTRIPASIGELPPGEISHLVAISPLPPFPDQSCSNRHEGPAVALVTVEADGRVVKVDILEAPDFAISEATKAAISQWRFLPAVAVGMRSPPRMGRIILYYILEGRCGHVLMAEDGMSKESLLIAR